MRASEFVKSSGVCTGVYAFVCARVGVRMRMHARAR